MLLKSRGMLNRKESKRKYLVKERELDKREGKIILYYTEDKEN